jgi:hypothetical protein
MKSALHIWMSAMMHELAAYRYRLGRMLTLVLALILSAQPIQSQCKGISMVVAMEWLLISHPYYSDCDMEWHCCHWSSADIPRWDCCDSYNTITLFSRWSWVTCSVLQICNECKSCMASSRWYYYQPNGFNSFPSENNKSRSDSQLICTCTLWRQNSVEW